MPRINLTVRKLESLRGSPSGQIDYWDDSLPGFGVRISPSSRKTWVVLYRHHRRLRRLTLGTYPAISLADARVKAREAVGQIASGKDPATEKRLAQYSGKTFRELSAEYLERHAKPSKKSWRADAWIIRRKLAKLRTIPARDVSRSDVRAVIESISDKGRKVLANRTLALLNKIFNFAIERDWRTDNPCQGLHPSKETSRDRVLNDDELKRIWDALEQEDPFCQALFKLRLLTAQRGGEVRHMKWADVDLSAGEWLIPASGAKNGIAHSVPLTQQAVEILNTLRAWQDQRLKEINKGRLKKKWALKERSEWVFPSAKGDHDNPFEWEQRVTKRIRRVSGVDFKPHDLRRTVGTLLTKHCKVDRFILKRILNHVDNDITAVYDRNRYDDQKRVALDAWGRRLKAIVEERETRATVVPLTKGKK